MKKFIAIAALGLSLSGCITDNIGSAIGLVSSFTVTQRQLDGTMSAYRAALAPALQYAGLPFCAPKTPASLLAPCSNRSVVIKIAAANDVVQVEFKLVQDRLTAGDASGVLAAYAILQSAISSAMTIAAEVRK